MRRETGLVRAAGDRPDDARGVAVGVARSMDLVGDAEVLQHSNNVVVRFGEHVLKVSRLARPEIEREVRLAREGARLGAPVLAPSGEAVVVGDYVVSAWPYVEGHHQPEGWQVAEALSVFHEVMSTCTVPLPRIATSLRETAVLASDAYALAAAGESDRALLTSALRAVADAAEAAEGVVVVHGEPHDRNLLATEQGVVLIDLEGAMRAPAEWDLGFRDPSEVERFWPDADRELLKVLRVGVSARVSAACWRHVTSRPEDLEMRWHAEHHLARVRKAVG